MARCRRVAALAAALLILAPVRAGAHVIHTTFTLLTLDTQRRTATVSLRAFADDFSVAVARAARRSPPRDSSVSASDAADYVRARLVLEGAVLVPCGVQRAGDVFLLCFRATWGPGQTLRMSNRLLLELHPDQVNVVQLRLAGQQRTQLFTRSTTGASLDLR